MRVGVNIRQVELEIWFELRIPKARINVKVFHRYCNGRDRH